MSLVRNVLLHVDLACSYLAQFLKARLEYKVDFLVGFVTSLLFNGIMIIFIEVLFARQTSTLNGWTKAQVFFIYGFSLFPQTLFGTFFSNLYNVGGMYIVEGNLDRVLLRPLSSLFQVLMERIRIEALTGLAVGVAVLWYASVQLDLVWTFGMVLVFVVYCICGMLIFAGVFITLASLSFWWPDRMGLMPPVYNLIAFGKYPITIYNPFLQFVLMWIIPFAFVAFFPSTHFLNEERFRLYFYLTPVVALGCAAIGFTVWNLGVKRYESTGS
jgi:ABC-2 type transport system permease protein